MGCDAVFGDGGHVLGIFAAMQDAAVNFGVQRLDAAVEHFGEAGEFGDVFDGDAGIAQQLGGASGGDEFDVQRGEFAGEVDEPGLVGDAEDGALDAGRHDGLGSNGNADWRPKILSAIRKRWSDVRAQWRVSSFKRKPLAAEFAKERPRRSQRKSGSGRRTTDDQRSTINDSFYVLALAFSFTWPSVSSTEYSTFSQWYCLRICSVFFCTKVVKESMLPETFSPAFFLAATSVL